MKTDAVMCIAFTRHRPSLTPLFSTSLSTVPEMLTNPTRFGTSNDKYSVRLFIRFRECGSLYNMPLDGGAFLHRPILSLENAFRERVPRPGRQLSNRLIFCQGRQLLF